MNDERPSLVRNPFSDSFDKSTQSAHSTNSHTETKRPLITYLLDGEYEKPWINDRRVRRSRIGNYIIWGFVSLALVLSAYYIYAETLKVHKYQVSSTAT